MAVSISVAKRIQQRKQTLVWLRYTSGTVIMEADDRQVTTVFTVQPSFHHWHSTTKYHEVLPLSVNNEVRCDCKLADGGNASWYSVCWVPMVEWRLDCEDCRHLTVVSLHDTGPRWNTRTALYLSDNVVVESWSEVFSIKQQGHYSFTITISVWKKKRTNVQHISIKVTLIIIICFDSNIRR